MENQRAPYRNAIRSRTMIRNAFLQLMRENDIARIKAKDVIAHANISKGTFYVHYNNVFDVYTDIEEECLASMFKMIEDQIAPMNFKNLLGLLLSGLEEVEKQRDTFHLLFCSDYSERFLNKIKERFINCMTESCEQNCRFQEKAQIQGFFTFAAGGALTLIREWIDTEERVSSEACAHFINQCIFEGMSVIDTNSKA